MAREDWRNNLIAAVVGAALTGGGLQIANNYQEPPITVEKFVEILNKTAPWNHDKPVIERRIGDLERDNEKLLHAIEQIQKDIRRMAMKMGIEVSLLSQPEDDTNGG